MKYKLIKQDKKNFTPIERILYNRGISLEEMHHYLFPTDKDINSFNLLGEDLLKKAMVLIGTAIREGYETLIVVDSDCDGATSSAVLLNYLHYFFPSWVENKVSWYLHSEKVHGLTNECMEYISNNNFKLIILPDAGSNDLKQHKILKENNIEVICLDHHITKELSEDAVVINNQLSEYPNKDFSGAGVTWQFCRYFDSVFNADYSDQLLDLVALGLTADMVSLRSIETRHLINKGFLEDNIRNPFIYSIWQKNRYKLGDKITSWGAAFYIAPFVNAIMRCGTLKEKTLLFESMLNFKAFEQIPSTKRGHLLGEMESIVEQVMRVCTNVKNRQLKLETEGTELVERLIQENNMLDHKALVFTLDENAIKAEVRGLVANKIANKYQRPCLVLTKSGTSYVGSARGYERTGLLTFKNVCEEAPGCLYAAGHLSAFGVGIKEEAVPAFVEFLDNTLKDLVSDEPVYSVDYIYQNVNINPNDILAIADMNDLWGKDMEESLIAIEGLKVTKDMLTLMSPDKSPTLKITVQNQDSKIQILKFGFSQEEFDKLYRENGYIELNIIGKSNKNEWNGFISPQIFIEDYEIIGEGLYYF